jgi:GTP1/Obg family GTP-binding protein
MTSLHPFEAALLDLTVGAATYASVLGKVDALRKALQEVRGYFLQTVGLGAAVGCMRAFSVWLRERES